MITIEGKNGIKATIICDSICNYVRLTTMEVEYPRIIHAEVMTHRMFSRNAASSRAIPFEKMLKQLYGKPVRFGANQAGMQDNGDHDALIYLDTFEVFDNPSDSELYEPVVYGYDAERAWDIAKIEAIATSKAFADAGFHKQICNRLTEPFQMMKVLISATEWDNFFWLRCDEAADPTLQELARVMELAREDSKPFELRAGEWHLPYLGRSRGFVEEIAYFDDFDSEDAQNYNLEDAIKVSAARCAAVSYRNVDYSLDKSKEVYDRLVGAEKKHGSALEHQATPMEVIGRWNTDGNFVHLNAPYEAWTWQDGVSHVDKGGNLWSANFKQWIQHRKLLSGENYTK